MTVRPTLMNEDPICEGVEGTGSARGERGSGEWRREEEGAKGAETAGQHLGEGRLGYLHYSHSICEGERGAGRRRGGEEEIRMGRRDCQLARRLGRTAGTYWLISKEGPAQTAMKAHLDHVLSEGGDGRVSWLTPLYDPSSSSVLSLSMSPISIV